MHQRFNHHLCEPLQIPLEMPFGMRHSGAWGRPLSPGPPWWMAWHDYTENLGLEWGCRPALAWSFGLPRRVVHLLIWWFSLLLEALFWASGAAPSHRRGIPDWALSPGEMPSPAGGGAQQVRAAPRRSGGRGKLELEVAEHLNPENFWRRERPAWACGWSLGGGLKPFWFTFSRKGWLHNLETLGTQTGSFCFTVTCFDETAPQPSLKMNEVWKLKVGVAFKPCLGLNCDSNVCYLCGKG